MLQRISLALAGMLMLAAQVAAQTSDPAWFDKVSAQAAEKLGCDVTLFISSRESELGGQRTFEVRIQCADGRRFDASRVEPETEFTFAACNTQVC